MENNQQFQPGLSIGEDTSKDMSSIGKWAGFLAIVGFIMLALMIVVSFSILFIAGPVPAGPYGQTLPKGFIFFIYLVFVVVYFFPTWYLFRFSDLLRKSVYHCETSVLNASFRYLKKFFIYLGILAIIMLVLVLIAMLAGLAGGRLF